MNPPLLSIVLINYRYFHDLKNAIESILESRFEFPIEVIVVNVPSGDGTEEFMESLQKKDNRLVTFTLVQAHRFSISTLRNAGIKHSKGKYILIMDTDLTLAKNALDNALKFMESHVNAGIAGFNLYHEDGSSQYNGRTFPTPLTIIARRSFIGKILPEVTEKHLYYNRDFQKNIKVDWVSGATMLIRKEVIEKIGTFDERFKYGFEDVDMCYRARKAGYSIYVIANALGTHREMRRSSYSAWFAYQHLRSAIMYFAKHGWKAIFGRI